jgi:hypothetical protein
LTDRGVPYKAVASLKLLDLFNSGFVLGYSQIGKAVTAYPRDAGEFLDVVADLCDELDDVACPAVPFDRRVRADRPVFYRYGAFGGDRDDELVDDDGAWHKDDRMSRRHHPPWVTDPLASHTPPSAQPDDAPLVVAYGALSQRGKGGVYRALDFSFRPARRCVLKEGRRHGETEWSGRDGKDLVENEQRVLRALAGSTVRTPRLERTYELGKNAYSVLEEVPGSPLDAWLASDEARTDRAQLIAEELAVQVHALHRAGWVWRDCKPTNVILGSDSTVTLLDFEGACHRASPDRGRYGSPGYMAPMPSDHRAVASDDVYALGAVFIDLFGRAGRWSAGGDQPSIDSLPRHVAPLVREMMVPQPWDRPSSQEVVSRLLFG